MQHSLSLGHGVRRRTLALLATLFAALALSACGGGADESASGGPQAGTPPAPVTPTPVNPGNPGAPAGPVTTEPLPVGVDPAPAAGAVTGAVPNVLLVRFRPGTSTDIVREVIAAVGGRIIGSVPLTMLVQVQFAGTWTDARVEELIERLVREPGVQGAYRDDIQSAPTSVVTPVDPWSADTTLSVAWDGDFRTGWNWHLKAIRADEAWRYAYAEGRTVHPVSIGILDGGFTEHPDLVDMTILGKQVLPPSGTSGAAHGNHVAGIAAATGNNGRGVAGVVWRDATSTVVDGLDSTYADLWLRRRCFCLPQSVIEQGLATLIERGVKVINMSLGKVWWDPRVHTTLSEGYEWLPTDEAERQAILVKQRKLALDMLEALHFADKDVLLVQSAGNAAGDAAFNGHAASALWSMGQDDDHALREKYPTLDRIRERLLVVGALGPTSASTLSPAAYSNTGQVVGAWAPGGSGDCDDQPGCAILSTGTGGGLVPLAGTSMAAPTVTGLAGLLWQTNEGLPAGEIKRLITLRDSEGRTLPGFTVVAQDRGVQINARDSVIAALRVNNHRPVARANATRNGADLLLDGTGSSDPEGTTIANYVWVVADASGRTLAHKEGADLGSWTYTAPTGQAITIALTVVDQLGLRSRTVTVSVDRDKDPVAQPALSAPTLSSPGNGATGVDLRPTLRWSGGTAPNLELNVRDVTSGALVATVGLAGSATTHTLPAGVLTNGRRYRWNVSACPDAACASGFVVSSSFEFTTSAAALVAPTLSSPGNGATGVDLRPTLRWSGGTAPNLELNVRDVTSGALVATVGLAGSATSYALPSGVLTNGRRYRWNVSACPNTACTSGYLVSSSFELTSRP